MKLYTREQMIEAFNYGQNPKGFDWIGDMIDSLTPIELPSDEEIANKADDYVENDHILFVTNSRNSKRYGFADGAKWMKEQILNQNK